MQAFHGRHTKNSNSMWIHLFRKFFGSIYVAYVIIRMRGADFVQLWQFPMLKHSNASILYWNDHYKFHDSYIEAKLRYCRQTENDVIGKFLFVMKYFWILAPQGNINNSYTQRLGKKIWNETIFRARRCSIEQHVTLWSRMNPFSVFLMRRIFPSFFRIGRNYWMFNY